MWPGLVLFLDDPRIPLDNNGSERAARAPVVGRKNHYGSRSLRGTEVAATFYSLVESAKLNGLEPRLYLRVAVRAGLQRLVFVEKVRYGAFISYTGELPPFSQEALPDADLADILQYLGLY